MLALCQGRCPGCPARPPAGGRVVLLNGTAAAPAAAVAVALRRATPGDTVGPRPPGEALRAALAALQAAPAEDVAVGVEALLPGDVPPDQVAWGPSVPLLVLLYSPLEVVVRCAPSGEDLRRSLVQFGALLAGSEAAVGDAVQFVPRSTFEAAMAAAAARFGGRHPARMTAVAAFLRRQLGFENGDQHGVWVAPRFEHDLVVDVDPLRPHHAAKIIRKHLQPGAGTSSGAFLRWPAGPGPTLAYPPCLRRPCHPPHHHPGGLSDEGCLLCDAPDSPAADDLRPSPASGPTLQGTDASVLAFLSDTLGTLTVRAAPVVSAVTALSAALLDADGEALPLPVVVHPQRAYRHAATLIWLHGLGDSGLNSSRAMEDVTDRLPHVKFIFPTAPNRPISLLAGMRQRGWFDIRAFDFEEVWEDEEGVLTSATVLHDLVYEEHRAGTPFARIFVAGFSQGGAVATFGGLTFPERLGGIVCCSSYAPLQLVLRAALRGKAPDLPPIYMGHGTADVLIPVAYGRRSAEFLRRLGCSVRYEEYRGQGHDISAAQALDLLDWLTDRLHFPSPLTSA